MNEKNQEVVRDARQHRNSENADSWNTAYVCHVLELHILVPILVAGYFQNACGEPITRGLTVSVTLFCAGIGTLIFHVCSKFKVPAFLGSSFAFLGGFYTVANLNTGIYADMGANEKAAYACGGIVVAGLLYLVVALFLSLSV